MLKTDISMLGYRITRWKGLPMMHIGNGMVSIAHHVGWGGGALTNLYTIRWPMNEYLTDWSYAYGNKLFRDAGDGSGIGNINYAIPGDKIGYVEDSNIIIVEDEDFVATDVDLEVYYFCPMQSNHLNSFLIVAIIKNRSTSAKTFYVGYSNLNSYLRTSVTYLTARNAVTSKNAAGKTWIVGSPDPIDAAYIDGAWRTADYTATTPGEYVVRWQFTVNAGDTKVWTIINTFGNDETEALNLYNTLKTLNPQTLLDDNVRFWAEWLNKGKQWKTGVYEIDQLVNIILCLLKGSITPYHSLPAGVTGYSDSDWPPDTFLTPWGFALWGHHEEAKNYYGIRIKNLVDYVLNTPGKKLYRDLHISSLYGYTCGSGYSGEEYFELIIAAVEIYKVTKDGEYAEQIWSWIEPIINDMTANLILSGDFAGCFNWNHMNVEAVYEAWWIGAPNVQIGTQCVSSGVTLCIAKAYEQAAVIADVVGEPAKAVDYRSKSKTMRDKVQSLLWNPSTRQYYDYWADTEGYVQSDKGGNNYAFTWAVPGLSNILEARIGEILLLYHYNLVNLEGKGSPDNYLPTPAKSNWMLGKTEPIGATGDNRIIDSWFWGTVFSCIRYGLDDFLEHWFNLMANEYNRNGSFLFDEWAVWNKNPSSNYTMRRTMGMVLVMMAEYFRRLKPLQQRKFEYILEKSSSATTVFKPKQSGVDTFGNPVFVYESSFHAKASIRNLRSDEEVVRAGLFTTEDLRAEFKALTPIKQGDRLEWGNILYQVQTVQKHRFKDRVTKVECLCRRVVE